MGVMSWFRSKAYGCKSIYGHTLNVKSTDVITKEQGEYFLRQDVEYAEKEVNNIT